MKAISNRIAERGDLLKNTFYLGMAVKAGILTGAVIGLSQVLPVLAEETEVVEETVIVEETATQEEFAAEQIEVPTEQQIEDTELITQVHVANIGWMPEQEGDGLVGTTGRSLSLEAIKMDIDSELEGSIQYETYASATGWTQNEDGEMSGTTGMARPLEAFRASLTDELAEYYSIYYRAHVSDIGWMGWAHNGQTSGTVGYGNRLEALELKLIRNGVESPPPCNRDAAKEKSVDVQTHVANIGWQAPVAEGEVAGTTGMSLPIEAVKIKLNTEGTIKYETYVGNQGWQKAKINNEIAGTTGKATPLHAIRITLEGAVAEKYDVVYKAHVSNVGWMSWVRNGEIAGFEDQTHNLEALQVEVREKEITSPSTKTAASDTQVKEQVFAEGSVEKAALDIYNAFEKGEKKATVEIVSDHKLTYNELEKIDNIYIPGMPFAGDVFNMRFGTTFSSKAEEKDGKVINTVTYTVYQDRITQDEQKQVEKTLDKLFADNNVMAMSDYKKACFIYDWLVTNMTYTESNKHYSDYYGAIVDHKGTCDAYASAVYVMAQKAGLESRRMITRQHAWNIIEVDGKWYCLDATWGGRSQGHRFFFLNSEKDFGHEAEFADQKNRNTNNYKIYSSYDISPTSYPQEY